MQAELTNNPASKQTLLESSVYTYAPLMQEINQRECTVI